MSDHIFAAVTSNTPVVRSTDDVAWVSALLRAETALAQAQVRLGIIPAAVSEALEAVTVADIDLERLTRDTPLGGNPVIPLVSQLRDMAPESLRRFVHHGATSQDILDTGAMLVAKESMAGILDDVANCRARLAGLTSRHGSESLIGRTLLQQALPISAAYKLGVWDGGLRGCQQRLAAISDSLPIQLGGPVGDGASFGEHYDALLKDFAELLGLREAACWHTIRLPIADLVGGLAAASGVVAKVATDILLLSQNEIAEAVESSDAPGHGSSSSMAHKKNPIAAVSALASAKRAPSLAGHLYSCMAHEHERAAGSWHSEWAALVELLRATGSATGWLERCLAHLTLQTAMMRRHL